jgi:hypothetical protein
MSGKLELCSGNTGIHDCETDELQLQMMIPVFAYRVYEEEK